VRCLAHISAVPHVDAHTLESEFKAVSVRQGRVALDHFLVDVSMVVETIEELGPDARRT
jgi:hypothetical protein